MKTIAQPPNWGNDELTRILDTSIKNSYATFHNLPKEFTKLKEIDKCFHTAIESIHKTKNWFPVFFLLKAHSSFLASVQLGTGGFSSETFACLRLVLENSLYGIYLEKDDQLQEVWLNRHESVEAKKKVQNAFKIGSMFNKLTQINKATSEKAKMLYERTIDFGAHPNELALSQSLQMFESDTDINFSVMYLSENGNALLHSLSTCFQVGLTSLYIFRLIFRERFDIVGLSSQLMELNQNGKIEVKT